MEKLVNRYLDLSTKVEYYYQLNTDQKMELFNYSVSVDKHFYFKDFMFDKLTLAELINKLTKSSSAPGRRAPDKLYLINKKKNTYVYKGLSKKEYHVQKKKVYQQIENLKYIGSYRKTIIDFLTQFLGDFDDRAKLFEELKRIDDYIDKNKNLGL